LRSGVRFPAEENFIAATWEIKDYDEYEAKEGDIFEDKEIFFNNETLLDKENLNGHFSKTNRKILNDNGVDYMVVKGNSSETENLFMIKDHNVKIFGVFDGHGECGQLVSAFVQGRFLNCIRNESDGFFELKNLIHKSASSIRRKIRWMFKKI
jgi:hypothetical protein